MQCPSPKRHSTQLRKGIHHAFHCHSLDPPCSSDDVQQQQQQLLRKSWTQHQSAERVWEDLLHAKYLLVAVLVLIALVVQPADSHELNSEQKACLACVQGGSYWCPKSSTCSYTKSLTCYDFESVEVQSEPEPHLVQERWGF